MYLKLERIVIITAFDSSDTGCKVDIFVYDWADRSCAAYDAK
jgi:hypothetical protein